MTFTQSMERPGPMQGQQKKDNRGAQGGNAQLPGDARGKRRQDAEQMVRFVRDYQGLQRETTELRLKRTAPLPGIGQKSQQARNDANGIEKISENSPLLCTSPRSKNAPWSQVDQDLIDRANVNINSSMEFGIYGKSRLGIERKMPRRRHSDRNVNRRITADVRLPPLSVLHRDLGELRHHHEDLRSELPARPQAPSPSVTPPLPDEDRADCSQGSASPIDFIDTH